MKRCPRDQSILKRSTRELIPKALLKPCVHADSYLPGCEFKINSRPCMNVVPAQNRESMLKQKICKASFKSRTHANSYLPCDFKNPHARDRNTDFHFAFIYILVVLR